MLVAQCCCFCQLASIMLLFIQQFRRCWPTLWRSVQFSSGRRTDEQTDRRAANDASLNVTWQKWRPIWRKWWEELVRDVDRDGGGWREWLADCLSAWLPLCLSGAHISPGTRTLASPRWRPEDARTQLGGSGTCSYIDDAAAICSERRAARFNKVWVYANRRALN